MARQSIGVGSQANDGTGDTLRTGAQKVNSNFNEVYNKLGNGTDLQISITGAFAEGMTLRSNGQEFVPSSLNYNDLLNRPTIPDPQVQSNWIESDINSASYIQNKPGIPTTVSTLSDVLVSGPSIGDALRWNGTGWINQAVQESIVTSLDNLTDVTITSAAVGNVIRFNGTAWVNTALNYSDLYNAPSLSTVATSGDYDDLTNKPDLSVYLTSQVQSDWNATSGTAQILNKPTLSTVATSGSYTDLSNTPTLSTVATTGDYDDLTNKPDSLAPSRTTASGTTTSINNNFSANLTINGFKTYALYKVETSESAWVTIYTDVNARSNDTSRQETTDPAPGSGIIAEVITTGAETVMLTPGTIGWNNDDPASSNIYLKVVNKSGGPAAITVTLTLLQLEL
jgi:hypothetical protein